MSKLQGNKPERLKECILQLKEFCDSEGVKSVLQSANKNDAAVLVDFEEDRTEKHLAASTGYVQQDPTRIMKDSTLYFL